MARGGRRQGTPGKAYANRTDLSAARAPQQGTVTAAAGGLPAPTGQNLAPSAPPTAPPSGAFLTPDEVPFPTDPTARPNEPLTAPISTPMPVAERDDAVTLIRALMLNSPNPDLARLLARMETR